MGCRTAAGSGVSSTLKPGGRPVDNGSVAPRTPRLLAGLLVACLLGVGVVATSPPATAAPAIAVSLDGVHASPSPTDFWLASTTGQVWNFGSAPAYGGLTSPPDAPVVGVTTTPDRHGYWLVASDGGIFSFGDARFFGSTGSLALNQPVVGMAPTPDGRGYWLVARDGGIFAFGDARFFGSTGSLVLNRPVVGMAATADGAGYWLVASDGGIFAFGDAAFHGSTGSLVLNQPVVGMASAPDGGGYWTIAADGGIFAFGDAAFYGSMGATPTPDPAERVVSTPSGLGYWVVDQNGTAWAFGDAGASPPTQGLLFRPVTPGDGAVLFAFAQLGKPYIWGGDGPVGYDCSGLALASWESVGVSFARVSDDQYHTAGVAMSMSDLQAGDLVFWGSDESDWTTVDHTALYVGGGRIVEATGDVVQLNSLSQWGSAGVMPVGRHP